jgi:hypothetical protein
MKYMKEKSSLLNLHFPRAIQSLFMFDCTGFMWLMLSKSCISTVARVFSSSSREIFDFIDGLTKCYTCNYGVFQKTVGGNQLILFASTYISMLIQNTRYAQSTTRRRHILINYKEHKHDAY